MNKTVRSSLRALLVLLLSSSFALANIDSHFGANDGSNAETTAAAKLSARVSALQQFKKNAGHKKAPRSAVPDFTKGTSKKCVTKLQPAYPWEVVVDNKQTFRFIVMNYFTDLFDPAKVMEISQVAERYINKYFYPSWRVQAKIEFFIPPSLASLIEQFVVPGSFVTSIPQVGTFVPIFLVDQFSENVEPNFATAVHGSVSGIVMNGYSHLVYLAADDTFDTYPNLPLGTPWIVIPAGTVESGNGINAAVASNQSSGQGPTDFYSELALTLAAEMIEVMANPTGLLYTIDGNPLGFGLPNGAPTRNQFYLHEAVDPVSQGNANIFVFHGLPMPNFVLPAYFFPFANEVSHGTARYDILGHVSGPFQPYKGTQFVIYQDGVTGSPTDLTELSVGQYESTLAFPRKVTFTSFGSIYDYQGWGLTKESEARESLRDTLKAHLGRGAQKQLKTPETKKVVKVLASSHVGARKVLKPEERFQFRTTNGSRVCMMTKKDFACGELTKPHILPFQYIDADGFLTQRFVVVNYLPEFLFPDQVDAAIPVMNQFMKENYLPYWGRTAEIIANFTVTSPDSPQPVYDGTFVPLFMIPDEFFNLESFGALAITAGAFNTNNNLNPASGPRITDYLKDFGGFTVPDLPLGNPYLIFPRHNIAGVVDVTARDPITHEIVAGPFLAVPQGSAQSSDLPITAEGAIASPDINACSPLTPHSMDGKIGLNIRFDCDSLVYPNIMADAGAIATLTGFFGGATGFSGGGARVYGATMALADMEALMAAVTANPALEITIDNFRGGPTDIQTFVNIETHELEELTADPTYGDYIVYSDPPTDRAVLFTQYEPADPIESVTQMATNGVNSYSASPFPIPAYFVPNLRTNNFDSLGLIWRPLVAISRDQINWQQEGGPTSAGAHYGPLESSVAEQAFQNFGSLFDFNTFTPPFTPPSYLNPDPEVPVEDSPVASIYERLQFLNNVIFL